MSFVTGLNPGNPRGYLILLHMTLLLTVGRKLDLSSLPRLGGGLIIGLAVLTLLVFTVDRAQLGGPWFMALLILGDLVAVLATIHAVQSIGPWMVGGVLLLLAMASYGSSPLQVLTFSSFILSGFLFSVHRLGLMDTDTILIFPILLCFTLVFLNKARLVQAEIQRISETEEQTRNESMSDVLTGLPNRGQFLDRVTRSIQCSRQNCDFQFAVVFIDLDGFKPINDKFGHKAGDAVLRQTAKRLQGCLRKGDIVGRYGGDEFTLLINNVSGPSDAIRVAERVLTKLKEPVNVGQDVTVGASIGIALSTNLHERAEDLIRDADGAMYRAKAQGKNRFVMSDQSVDVPKEELKERWKKRTARAIG